MMLETLGLVETLEWHIADKMFLGIENFERAGIMILMLPRLVRNHQS